VPFFTFHDVDAGNQSLAEVANRALMEGLNPQPRSGRQEYLESLVNRFV